MNHNQWMILSSVAAGLLLSWILITAIIETSDGFKPGWIWRVPLRMARDGRAFVERVARAIFAGLRVR